MGNSQTVDSGRYSLTNGVRMPITDGPSKMDLMFNIFHYDSRAHTMLLFWTAHEELGSHIAYHLRMEGLELESRENNDKGGNHWRFKATLFADGKEHGIVHGRYNTSSRTGWMKGRRLATAE